MKNLDAKKVKQLIVIFKNLFGASFVSINNYLSQTSGQLANHLINANISVLNANKADYLALLAVTNDQLINWSIKFNIALDIINKAYNELLESYRKNSSENFEDHTDASKAQSNAYIQIANGLRLNIESMQLHILAMEINKTVLIPAEPKKPTKSNNKTIAKNKIKYELNFKSIKFRSFIIQNADKLKISGEAINL